jgi:hypothetical protein
MKSNANCYRKIIAVIGIALMLGGVTGVLDKAIPGNRKHWISVDVLAILLAKSRTSIQPIYTIN